MECEYLPNFNGGSGESPVTNIKLDITQGGTKITGTTRNVVVGQEISLATQVTPATTTITGQRWTVPGNRIAGYTTVWTCRTCSTSGKVTPLTNLTSDTINFYWVDGGDGRQVTISGTANGRAFTRKATFNVKRPTAQILTLTDAVDVSMLEDGNLYLHYGDRAFAPGIRFEKRVTLPVSGFNGDTQWVQLVTSSMRSRRPNGGVLMTLQGSGLDGDYPYPPVPNAPLFASDSPGERLFPTYTTQSVDDKFTMWLMFKPSGTAGTPIWVPLRKVNWHWAGNASRMADPNNPNNWVLNSAAWDNPPPPDADSTDHPQWTTNIRSYSYH